VELGVELSLVVEADIAAMAVPGLLSVLVPLPDVVELPPLLVLVLLHSLVLS
jgi:hypothetical protein